MRILSNRLFLKTRSWISVFVVSLFLTYGSYAQTTGSIKGKVTDRKTGSALPFVNVVVKGTNHGASTKEDGEFEIKGLTPGRYVLVVSIIGHETALVEGVDVVAGEVAIRNVSIGDVAVQIGDVTVYGASLRGERITDAPASVSVISPRDIKLNSASGQVPKLLETEAGVDIAQNGINDFNVNTRGFNSSLNRRLLILLDGRDLAVAFLGSQEWNGLSVPVEDLGRLELIRGPGSALYGANAFNGVVNILTPRPKDIVGGKITVAGGEKNTVRTDARYASESGSMSYKVNAGRTQGDTWSVSRPTLLNGALTFPFEYANLNPFLNTEVVPLSRNKVSSTYGSGRVDYEFEEGGRTTLEGGITQVENEVLVTGIGRVQVPKAVKPWGRANYSNEHLYAQAWVAGRNSLKPQVSLSTGLPLEEKSFISQLELQYRFSALEEKLFVILGAAHRYQSVGTKGTLTREDHYDNLSGLYGQLEYKLIEEVKAVLAGRWDRSTLHSTQFSPKVALVWTPVVGHSIRATFNKAFQAPNYSELFLNVKHPIRNLVYFGNEDLVVEKITGYEVGYKGVFSNSLFITLDGYYNQLKDFITDLAPSVNPKYPGQITLPGENITRTVWSYGNAGKVTEEGFELSANYYLTDNLQLTANYAFFDFTVNEKNANDVLLPNAPKHKVNAGVTYREPKWEVSVSTKYVPTFDWAAGIYKGPILAYTLVNLSGAYRLTPHLEFGVNITDLLDRKHYQIFGGSLIGRRAIFSMTATI
jgi:iron complex outermembrane receptor protein